LHLKHDCSSAMNAARELTATVPRLWRAGLQPSTSEELPPGACRIRVVGRSVITLPQFWFAPLAKLLEERPSQTSFATDAFALVAAVTASAEVDVCACETLVVTLSLTKALEAGGMSAGAFWYPSSSSLLTPSKPSSPMSNWSNSLSAWDAGASRMLGFGWCSREATVSAGRCNSGSCVLWRWRWPSLAAPKAKPSLNEMEDAPPGAW